MRVSLFLVLKRCLYILSSVIAMKHLADLCDFFVVHRLGHEEVHARTVRLVFKRLVRVCRATANVRCTNVVLL